jgi:hypothetical protein
MDSGEGKKFTPPLGGQHLIRPLAWVRLEAGVSRYRNPEGAVSTYGSAERELGFPRITR